LAQGFPFRGPTRGEGKVRKGSVKVKVKVRGSEVTPYRTTYRIGSI